MTHDKQEEPEATLCGGCSYFKESDHERRYPRFIAWDGWCQNMRATLGARDIRVQKTSSCNYAAPLKGEPQ